MKFKFTILVLYWAYCSQTFAQIPDGSPASDIVALDINNNGYSLFAAMAGGKSACIDFMATWCGPCWSFHNSQTLKNVHNNLGHLTSVVMLEGDFATNTNCLYGPSGCSGIGTQGNWTAGTPYPIVNLTNSNGGSAMGDYNVNYFPTLYIISPDFRVWEITTRNYNEYYNWIVHSFTLNATAQITHSTCGDNGRVDLSPTGGYASYAFKWSNGATTEDLVNMPGGTYSVTVTDNNGYFEIYGPWTVDGPDKRVSITQQTVQHNPCFAYQEGSVSVQVANGTPGYSFQWTNGDQTSQINNLTAGSYTLTVTDAAGCTISKNYQITQPALLKATISSGPETCDQKNGFIAVGAEGGTKPYYYDIGAGKKTNPVFDKLKGGDYKVTLTDSKQCFFTEEIIIDATHLPKVEAGANTQLLCDKDTVYLDGPGTDTGAEFLHTWSTKNGQIIGDKNNLQIRVVKEGTYILNIKNLLTGCENTDSVKVTDQRKYPDILASSDSLINCYYPEIFIQGHTKTKSAKYFWTQLNSTFKDTSATISVDDKGHFVFNVLDTVNQCLIKDTVIVDEDFLKPNVTILFGDINCDHPIITLDGSLSDQGVDKTFYWTTQGGRFVSGENTLNPSIDLPGEYALHILNSTNGCESSKPITVLEDKTLPKISFGQWPVDLSCLRNEMSIGLDQSIPDLIYHWYSENGGIISPDTSHQIVVNKSGNYQLKYKNFKNGCEDSSFIKVDEQTKLIPNFDYSIQDLEVRFNDLSFGKATSWNWEMGDGKTYSDQNPIHLFENQNEYEVCLEVNNECGLARICQLINLDPTANHLGLLSWEIAHVNCFGGTNGRISLQVKGGQSPYLFDWDHGSNNSEITNLAAGDYTVMITDQLGATISKTFTILQAPNLEYQQISIIPLRGTQKGSIELEIIGGNPPYTYRWSHGADTKNIVDLQAGSYELTVTDASLCTKLFGPFVIQDLTSTGNILKEYFMVFPQPANDHLIVMLQEQILLPAQAQIFNSQGKLILTRKFTSQGVNQLDLTSISNGVFYLVLTSSDNSVFTKRMIVLKD
ncbi:MAG: T9SS type A sorting domain-containing protein [Saprospiraceae bacterium]|nr:T9SS type A sorting domain-containing protein [Saprospiraceae bacterium]